MLPQKQKRRVGKKIAPGKIQYANINILENHISEISNYTEEQLSTIPFGKLTPLRKGGRPKKGVITQKTTTISFRFTKAFIQFLKLTAKLNNQNVTRYVEDAVMLKSNLDNALTLESFKFNSLPTGNLFSYDLPRQEILVGDGAGVV